MIVPAPGRGREAWHLLVGAADVGEVSLHLWDIQLRDLPSHKASPPPL